MTEDDGLICAYLLDGHGGGRQVGWTEIASWRADDGLLWVHLDRAGPDARRWLQQDSGLDPVIAGALLAEDVRPRELRFDDALLVVLRGVNLNPGADPEDMVGIRIWLEPTRILTVRHRRLMAISDLREAIATGRGQLRAPPGHAERPDARAHGARDRRSGRRGRPARGCRGHGGMPGANHPMSFAIVVGLIIALAVVGSGRPAPSEMDLSSRCSGSHFGALVLLPVGMNGAVCRLASRARCGIGLTGCVLRTS